MAVSEDEISEATEDADDIDSWGKFEAEEVSGRSVDSEVETRSESANIPVTEPENVKASDAVKGTSDSKGSKRPDIWDEDFDDGLDDEELDRIIVAYAAKMQAELDKSTEAVTESLDENDSEMTDIIEEAETAESSSNKEEIVDSAADVEFGEENEIADDTEPAETKETEE